MAIEVYGLVYGTTCYWLCRLELTQPVRKGNKVLKPRWKIVKNMTGVIILRKVSFCVVGLNEGESITRSVLIKKLLPKDAEELPILEGPIVDKQIKLHQIRHLFPETEVMPFYAALDYIREKLS